MINRKSRQPSNEQSDKLKPPPVVEARVLDEQCEGDVLWEQRMKKLNPHWRRSDYSLWDAYHE